MAGGTGGLAGSGGMKTKIEAAKIAMRSGVTMVIADGRRPDVIKDVAAGKAIGTRFTPDKCSLNSRKRWIAFGTAARGTVVVNEGARAMLADQGKSLLAAGIVDVVGSFKAGEVVAVVDETNVEIGRGFVNYSASDVRLIIGKHSSEIEAILGYKDFDEVIHRDNLALGV